MKSLSELRRQYITRMAGKCSFNQAKTTRLAKKVLAVEWSFFSNTGDLFANESLMNLIRVVFYG